MKTFLSIVWHFPFFGFMQAIFFILTGIFFICTLLFIPVGLGYIQMGIFMFNPFNSVLVSRSDFKYVDPSYTSSTGMEFFNVVNRVLFFIPNLFTVMGFLGTTLCSFIGIITIPCGLVYFRMLASVFNPVNKVCVTKEKADQIKAAKYGAPTEGVSVNKNDELRATVEKYAIDLSSQTKRELDSIATNQYLGATYVAVLNIVLEKKSAEGDNAEIDIEGIVNSVAPIIPDVPPTVSEPDRPILEEVKKSLKPAIKEFYPAIILAAVSVLVMLGDFLIPALITDQESIIQIFESIFIIQIVLSMILLVWMALIVKSSSKLRLFVLLLIVPRLLFMINFLMQIFYSPDFGRLVLEFTDPNSYTIIHFKWFINMSVMLGLCMCLPLMTYGSKILKFGAIVLLSYFAIYLIDYLFYISRYYFDWVISHNIMYTIINLSFYILRTVLYPAAFVLLAVGLYKENEAYRHKIGAVK
ncbi:MAG: hypothetical protein R3Y61_02125 [Rikenellaceae bacterium]